MTLPGHYDNQKECVYWVKRIFHVLANQSEDLQGLLLTIVCSYQQEVSIKGKTRLGRTKTELA
jgi:hypothetical protein